MNARFFDTLNLISKLSVPRISNTLLVAGSYYYSRIAGKAWHRGVPWTVSIEPTTSCNLRCPECPSGLRKFSRPTGALSLGLYKRIIDELSPQLFYLNLYFQGEPYLNPLFFHFVEYAGKRNIYTMTSTNAHFLNDALAKKTVESGLDKLIISIDGTDQETYEKYRVGGSLEKVMTGLENLLAWKKKLRSGKPYLEMQFIVFGTNEHQVGEIKKLAARSGVDKLSLKTAQVYDHRQGNALLPSDEKYSRYKKNGSGKYRIDNPLYDHCFRMWRGCVITWDGLVVPCCFDKDARHQLGDIKEQTFIEIWKGDRYNDFRNSVFSSRKDIDICRNCTEK